MEKISPAEEIDQDRRRLFGTAAMTIAAAGTSSFVAAPARAAAEADAIRPFRLTVFQKPLPPESWHLLAPAK